MGGGKGTASGGAMLQRMEERGRGLMRGTKDIRKQVLGQGAEALRTGGVGAQIPMIQRALEGQKATTSEALQRFGETSGLAGTPFGERIQAQIGQQGGLAQQQTITDLVNQAIGRGMDLTQLQTQAAGNMFGGATNLQQLLTQGNLTKIGLLQQGLKSALTAK